MALVKVIQKAILDSDGFCKPRLFALKLQFERLLRFSVGLECHFYDLSVGLECQTVGPAPHV